MGFSAGGHLAVMTAISFEKRSYEPIDEVDRSSCRPDFAVVAYPGYILTRPGSAVLAEYLRIPKGTGPMFLVHASDDDEPGAQPEQSLALYRALRDAGVPAELHIYDEGGHGFGVRKTGRPGFELAGAVRRVAEATRHPPGRSPWNKPARHDRPPRKVIVGTTMTRWYSDYPGLSGRLEQMRRLIDQMAAESRPKYGRSIDLALFTEYAVTAGKPAPRAEIAVPLDDTILGALGVQGARAQHLHCLRRCFSRRSGQTPPARTPPS